RDQPSVDRGISVPKFERPNFASGSAPCGLLSLLSVMQDAACPFQKAISSLSDFEFGLSAAYEQQCTNLPFELLDLMGESGRRDTESFRGTRKVFLFTCH